MISFKNAQVTMMRETARRRVKAVALQNSLHRVLTQDVFARKDHPAVPRAIMDGFAVRAKDVLRAPVVLKVIETVPAGKIPKYRLKKGTCANIATGAALPAGADAVVMKEDTQGLAGSRVEIFKKIYRSDNVYRKGQIFRKGERLLKAGAELNAAAIGLLASQGFSSVKVFDAPRVALLSTGNEIADGGQKKTPSQIWNATAPMLMSLLRSDHIPVSYLGVARDDRKLLLKKIAQGLRYDIFMITGAVSVGDFDLVPGVLKKAGVRTIFHRVAIRPGKPLFFGRRGCTLIFGLPGNPVSSWLDFILFIKPAIQKMLGLDVRTSPQEGYLGKRVSHEPDRLSFWPARVISSGQEFRIDPLRYGGSADLESLAKANALALLNRHQRTFAKNSRIKFLQITQ